MNVTRVRALTLVAIAALGASVLAGCGGSGGGTTTTATPPATTAPGDGTVTIQTDTVVTNTAPPTGTTGITGNAQLDAAITAMAKAIRGTMADLNGSGNAAALTTAITVRSREFDRAVQQVHDVVPEDGAQTNTQQAIADAAPALSQAYRDFSDAAAQAADSNDAAALASAKGALTDALHTFDEAAGTGN
jgi:hypothetical protein